MSVLVTCINEEDPIKNYGARVSTTLYSDFFRRSRASNSVISGLIWVKILTHPMMYAFPCLLQESPIVSLEGFFSDAQGQLTLKSVVKWGRILIRYSVDNIVSIISLSGFFQMLKGSLLRCPWSDLAKFLICARYYSR